MAVQDLDHSGKRLTCFRLCLVLNIVCLYSKLFVEKIHMYMYNQVKSLCSLIWLEKNFAPQKIHIMVHCMYIYMYVYACMDVQYTWKYWQMLHLAELLEKKRKTKLADFNLAVSSRSNY